MVKTLFLIVALLFPAMVLAQPGPVPGMPISGGVFTGKVTSVASSTGSAGFNLNCAAAPASPQNGDMWCTSSGLYMTIGATTYGPFIISNGTVTSVAVAPANGFSATVVNSTTTPVLTIKTSVTGLMKGNGTAASAAIAGTDYLLPTGSGAHLAAGTIPSTALANTAVVAGNYTSVNLTVNAQGQITAAANGSGGGGGAGDVQQVTCSNNSGDAALIQTALNSGYPVHINTGICNITAVLTVVTPGQFIYGDGRSQTILATSSTALNPGLFNVAIAGGSNFVSTPPGPIFQDFAIQFSQPNTSSRASLNNYHPAIYAQNIRYAKFFRLRITEAMVGIDMRNSSGMIIDDLEMSAFSVGIWIDNEYDVDRINNLHTSFFGPDIGSDSCGIGSTNTGLCAILGASVVSGAAACVPSTTSGSNPPIVMLIDGRADGVFISNSLFFFGMNLCALTNGNGTPFLNITNTGFDTYNGIYADTGSSGISISSSYFSPYAWNTSQAIVLQSGELSCSSCFFYTGSPSPNPSATIQVQGTGASVLNITNSQINVTANSPAIDTLTSGGLASVMVSNTFFSSQSSVALSYPVIRIRSGVRATLTGNRINDKGSNAATFIQLDADDWHNVTGNTAPGWTETSASPANAIIALNNPAFSNSNFGAISTSGAFTAASVTTTSGGVTVPVGQKVGDSGTFLWTTGGYGTMYLNGGTINYNGAGQINFAIGGTPSAALTTSLFTAPALTTSTGGITVPIGQRVGDANTFISTVSGYGELYLHGATLQYDGSSSMGAYIGATPVWTGTTSRFILPSGIVPHAPQSTFTVP